MKLIASIIQGDGGGGGGSGFSVQLPDQIAALNDKAGIFGIGILRLVGGFLGLAAILIALFVLMYGGFLWITSQGDKKKIEDARNTLVFAVIGLIVVSLAFFIINILGAFFKVPILTVPTP